MLNRIMNKSGSSWDCLSGGFFAAIMLCLFSLLAFPSWLMAHTDNNSTEAHPEIRIVMSGAFVSESGIKVYEDIAQYLQKKLQHKVVFVSGFSYATINAMLDSGMADIGFVCGLPYVMQRDQEEPAIDLLLAPVMKDVEKYKDQPVYYSYVIVHKDSKFKNFADLKGSRFAFNDEISNSGYNMPRAHLIDMGETHGFFSEVTRSGSHEESIRMVAQGVSDASAVDSLVYDYDAIKNPEYVKQTRILKVLGPAGIPPVVVSVKTAPAWRKQISEILLGMKNDPDGRAILDEALVDRFSVVDDSNYDSIRAMQKLAQDSGYRVIR